MMGIDPGGTRLSVLAERAQIAKQTATALVDRLERAGYVERVADPTDGRARLVRMTSRAKEAIPHARAEEERIEEEWRAHLGTKRMQQFRKALTDLRKITDPYQGSPRCNRSQTGGRHYAVVLWADSEDSARGRPRRFNGGTGLRCGIAAAVEKVASRPQ